MSNFDLQKILEAWMLATGTEKEDFDKIRCGVESDWMCHKAKKMLTKDPTGVLSAFAMRSAYVKYISEHNMSVKELINGEWDKIKDYWINLYNQLYVDNAGPLISETEEKIITVIKNFGEDVTLEDLYANNFEEVFVDAFDKYDTYKADVFKHPTNTSNDVTFTVSKKLHYFEHYKQFVEALKNSEEDNIVVVAFIDRTAEKIETDYDQYYDKFFAFGIKRDGGVAVVSDRVAYSSLEHSYKTRNPGRDLDNKMDFSHLPYYKFDKIIAQFDKPSQLLLTSGLDDTTKFNDEFDVEGYIYIATILSIIYNKYFETDIGWNKEHVLFSSEVKFLTPAQSKDLIVRDKTAITLPEVTCTASDYKGKSDVHNHGIYDFYSEMFPVTDVVKFNFNAIATKEDMENNAWWAVRKAQADAVKKGLRESYTHARQVQLNSVFAKRIADNLPEIFEYAITHNDNRCFDKYVCDRHGPNTDDTRPVIYEEWSKQAELDTIQITSKQYKSTSDWFEPKYWSNRVYVNNMAATTTSSCVDVWWPDDNNNRAVELKFYFRSYSDLVKYLKFNSVEELPKELQHWLYARVSCWSMISWRPYRGNSILSLTDPMNDIEDPWHNYPIYVVFHMSKSKYNKLVKEHGNKRTCGIQIEED